MALLLVAGGRPASGAEPLAELFPGLDETGAEPSRPAARPPRPTAKIAEDVTVVTAEQIARINAHTLADILQSVPGIQYEVVRTPGDSLFFFLLGFDIRHVLVQVDGVPQNFLGADLFAATGSIPAQGIERVEIVKGAASTAWGSALGGVINVVTKSPAPDRAFGGTVSASTGERDTNDLRVELSGTADRSGYYLSGGTLHSGGLSPGNRIDQGHAFAKWTYDLPGKGELAFGASHRASNLGFEDSSAYDLHDSGGDRHASAWLRLDYPLADRLSLSLDGHAGQRKIYAKWGTLVVPTLFWDASNKEDFSGVNLRLDWGDRDANLVAGLGYEHDGLRSRESVQFDPGANFALSMDRWSAYVNGTYTIGRLTLLPGIRLDHSNLFGDAASGTMGATLRLGDATLLRGYAARGHGLPVVSKLAITSGANDLQEVRSAQVGIESVAIPGLWLKGTFFRNNVWNIQQFDFSTLPPTVGHQEQVRQGYELEGKTSPLHGFALSAGYTAVDAWDRATGAKLSGSAAGRTQGLKAALHYDSPERGTRGALTGNYIWWNLPARDMGQYKAMILDLHLSQALSPGKADSPELFFSGRNLFNGSQYQIDIRPNPRRWVEGGVRMSF